jgi:hypothetical protein
MTVVPMLKRTLVLDALLAVAIAVIGGGIGLWVAGTPGVLGAVIGAALTFVFMGLTALTVILAARTTKGDLLSPLFFGIVLGGWMVKLAIFLVVAIVFGRSPAIDPLVLFFTVVASVVGSLAIDVYAFMTSRMGYVSDVKLPHETGDSAPPKPSAKADESSD